VQDRSQATNVAPSLQFQTPLVAILDSEKSKNRRKNVSC
jgi:hypothetical protein